MPDDLNEKPGTVTRLLRLTETWTRETTQISGYLEEMRNLARSLSSCNAELKKKVDALCVEVKLLRTQCESTRKKSGLTALPEWMMKSAKEQPLAFAMVFMTIVMFLILLTVLGYKLNLQSLLGA